MTAGVDLWAAHFGFAATPFTKTVAADKLFARRSHDEAVARIRYCITESALGVITGDVGVGKTVALRAAVSGLVTAPATPSCTWPTPREDAGGSTSPSRQP